MSGNPKARGKPEEEAKTPVMRQMTFSRVSEEGIVMEIANESDHEDETGPAFPEDFVTTNICSFTKEPNARIFTEKPTATDAIKVAEDIRIRDESTAGTIGKMDPEEGFKKFVVEGQDPLVFSDRSFRKAAESFVSARQALGIDLNIRFKHRPHFIGVPANLDPRVSAVQQFGALMKKKYEKFTTSKQAKAVAQLSDEGLDDNLICAMLGLKQWQVNHYRQVILARRRPLNLPKRKIDLPFQKYYVRAEPKVVAWFFKEFFNLERFESTPQVQQKLMRDLGIKLSLTAIRRILKQVLKMKYKKIVQLDTRANLVDSKRKRQFAAAYFAASLQQNQEIINIDESSIQVTYHGGRAWGPRNQRIIDCRAKRLDRIHIVAAISSYGRGWFRVGFGKNNSATFSYFLHCLCKELQKDDLGWRKKTVFLLDNARYHRSKHSMAALEQTKTNYLFLGPYSFDSAPVEKVFANIKKKDLNTANMNFENRRDKGHYLRKIAETIQDMRLGNLRDYFKSALLAAEEHFMFQSI